MSPTRRLVIALVASAALNLFFAGFLVARGTHRGWHGREHRAPGHGPFFGPRGMRDADPAAEAAMRRVMDRHREALQAQRATLRQARSKVSAAFSAEPFDAKGLQAALGELRAQTAESQRLLHESLVEVAPGLTPAQRQKLGKHAPEREPGRRGLR